MTPNRHQKPHRIVLSDRLLVKPILVIGGFVLLLVFGLLVFGRFSSSDTQQVQRLLSEADESERELTALQSRVAHLAEENAKLLADQEGGRTLEEEQAALDVRYAELEDREQRNTQVEELLRQRELTLQQAEREFYEATNMTQQEIGQAKQIRQEYELMRQARDAAQDLANRWLMIIYAMTAALFVMVIVAVVLGMKYWSNMVRYRAEMEQRREVFQLLSATVGSSTNPRQSEAILSAVGRIAGLPGMLEDKDAK